MAHELSFINGQAEFAYLVTDGLAWHGFGQPVEANESIETWLAASNMGNWDIKETPVLFYDKDSRSMMSMDNRKVLYRSDSNTPLADVSSNYKVVQPRQIVEFFTDLIDKLGFELSTMGVLFNGRKFWCQANIGQTVHILGKDRVDGKLLLSTSCDGSLATTGMFTAVRVVCNNTLTTAINSKRDYVKMDHRSEFNPQQFKDMMEINKMTEWARLADEMARYKLSSSQAIEYFEHVFGQDEEENGLDDEPATKNNKTPALVYDLFSGKAKGSEFAPDSLWNAVNSVTEWSDHYRNCKTMDSRMQSAWFGSSAQVKNRAWDIAEGMVVNG